jgi:hypothetical protein
MRVQLVEHDALERAEEQVGMRMPDQQAQLLRRGQQDLRRIGPLPRSLVPGRVAGPRLHLDLEVHLQDRRHQIALHVHRQRLERRNVKRVQPERAIR